jgi:hypothetical protein
VVYLVESETEDDHLVVDMGRDILEIVISALAFLSASPVRIEKTPSFSQVDDAGMHRRITLEDRAPGHGPLPLRGKDILGTAIPPRIGRVLTWLRKGLQEPDALTSILCLSVAIEILAECFDCPIKTLRTCPHCGITDELAASTGQKVRYLLKDVLGFANDQAELMWEARNRATHGVYDQSSKTLRVLDTTKQDMAVAIIRGAKKALGLGSEDGPPELPPDSRIYDHFVVIDGPGPEVHQRSERQRKWITIESDTRSIVTPSESFALVHSRYGDDRDSFAAIVDGDAEDMVGMVQSLGRHVIGEARSQSTRREAASFAFWLIESLLRGLDSELASHDSRKEQ